MSGTRPAVLGGGEVGNPSAGRKAQTPGLRGIFDPWAPTCSGCARVSELLNHSPSKVFAKAKFETQKDEGR